MECPRCQEAGGTSDQECLPPSMFTDKDIKTRVYCYGTLFAAYKEGKGNLAVDKLPHTPEFEYVRALLSMGVSL